MRGDEQNDKVRQDGAYHGAGHRARLRERLFSGNQDGLSDHEIIEYLLATAIPRRDTKQLAKELLRQFGGIEGLFTADAEAISRVDGMGDAAVGAIKIVQAATVRLLKRQVDQRPVLSSWSALLDYLRVQMAYNTNEQVRILHLNSRNILVHDEVLTEGSIDQAAVYVREVVRRVIGIGSASIILVHNHPSGDPTPSRQDISLTRDIIEVGRTLGITVHDHIIIGTQGHTSMRSAGLI